MVRDTFIQQCPCNKRHRLLAWAETWHRVWGYEKNFSHEIFEWITIF